jgi:hypothetical protein
MNGNLSNEEFTTWDVEPEIDEEAAKIAPEENGTVVEEEQVPVEDAVRRSNRMRRPVDAGPFIYY